MDAGNWFVSESTQAAGERSAGNVALQRKLPLHGAMMSVPEPAATQASFDTLIEAVARDRDRAAFAELFEHFAPRLKSYLMRLGTDDMAAEEVVQEAMVMVWRKADSFDRRQASASTWIFTIARNKRIDRLRRERRPELDPNDPALIPDPVEQADRTVQTRQSRDRILSAVEKLPAEQSELIRMAYFDEKSHAEIAAEMALPLGTVKSRIRLALGRMRREVQDLV